VLIELSPGERLLFWSQLGDFSLFGRCLPRLRRRLTGPFHGISEQLILAGIKASENGITDEE
jgi:hypothetical protein